MIERLSSILARIILSAFFLTLVVSGIFIGGTAFHDPDTCWLLGLGRFICENHAIPKVEPFSYTFADLNRPLVLYQWLTECCFYLAVKFGGLAALLSLISLSTMAAFIVLPLKLFARAKSNWLAALGIIFVGLSAASFHFLARPEIFSYVFLSVLLFLLSSHRLARRSLAQGVTPPINWRFVGGLFVLMVFWSNCHTGFVSGLVVLLVYLLADIFGRLVFRLKPVCDQTVVIAFVSGVAASLFNPYGTGLWGYIPSLFFADFNKMIDELHAVSLKSPEFYPFILLLVIFAFCFFTRCKELSTPSGLAYLSSPGHLSEQTPGHLPGHLPGHENVQLFDSLIIFLFFAFEGLACLRLIPFVVLILINEMALLTARSGEKIQAPCPSKECLWMLSWTRDWRPGSSWAVYAVRSLLWL